MFFSLCTRLGNHSPRSVIERFHHRRPLPSSHPPWAPPTRLLSLDFQLSSQASSFSRSSGACRVPWPRPYSSRDGRSPWAGVGLSAWPRKQAPGGTLVSGFIYSSLCSYRVSTLGDHARCLCSGLYSWRWTREMGPGLGVDHDLHWSPCAETCRSRSSPAA